LGIALPDLLFFIVFGAIGVLILVWFVFYALSVWRGDYRHTKGAKSVWWVPGGGGHGGGGGQVPPIVTNDDD
jgi:hypothetical protein